MKQITLQDDHLEWIIEKLGGNDPRIRDRDAMFLRYHAIDVSNDQADISTRLLQAGYDNKVLRDKIKDLERERSAKTKEIIKLQEDKTAALKEFIEELRREPLNVVLVNENGSSDDYK